VYLLGYEFPLDQMTGMLVGWVSSVEFGGSWKCGRVIVFFSFRFGRVHRLRGGCREWKEQDPKSAAAVSVSD